MGYNENWGKENLVSSRSEIEANIKTFNEGLEKGKYVREQLSRYTDWYYNPVSDEFGPKKFVGFKEMTFEKYELLKRNNVTNTRRNFDSSITTGILDEIYPITVDTSNPLYVKLSSMLAVYGKKLGRGAVIHLPV